MSIVTENINRISDKLQQLLKQYQQLQKDNLRQGKLIKELQEQKKQDTEQLNALQEQVAILKSATGGMNESDKKNFEKHISQYIKEIEKCIAYLTD